MAHTHTHTHLPIVLVLNIINSVMKNNVTLRKHFQCRSCERRVCACVWERQRGGCGERRGRRGEGGCGGICFFVPFLKWPFFFCQYKSQIETKKNKISLHNKGRGHDLENIVRILIILLPGDRVFGTWIQRALMGDRWTPVGYREEQSRRVGTVRYHHFTIEEGVAWWSTFPRAFNQEVAGPVPKLIGLPPPRPRSWPHCHPASDSEAAGVSRAAVRSGPLADATNEGRLDFVELGTMGASDTVLDN